VPLNLRLGKTEIPLGVAAVTLILFSVALVNLVTKQVATISGLFITAVFSTVFFVSERINERNRKEKSPVGMDQFRLQPQETLSVQTVEIRPGNVLCLVRDYNSLEHLRKALELIHTGQRNLVVMTVKLLRGPVAGYKDIDEQRLFSNYEQLLFSRVVSLAEKAGKHVDLLVVPSSNVYQAIAHTAFHLQSSEVILGRSAVMTPEEQCLRLGQAWEEVPDRARQQVRCRVIESSGRMYEVILGAHAPVLSQQDIERIHQLWLNITSEPSVENLHHKDIVRTALARLEHDLNSSDRKLVIAQMLGTNSLEIEDDRGNDYY